MVFTPFAARGAPELPSFGSTGLLFRARMLASSDCHVLPPMAQILRVSFPPSALSASVCREAPAGWWVCTGAAEASVGCLASQKYRGRAPGAPGKGREHVTPALVIISP